MDSACLQWCFKLMPVNERVGMIMELPPYHKPHWKILFKTVARNVWAVFKKAIVVIWIVSLLFWLVSYSKDGVVEHSVLYTIGNAIEPFTQIFGMRWQLFISYLGGIFSKEASLGVMSVVFASTNDAFSLVARNEAGANLEGKFESEAATINYQLIFLAYLRWEQRIAKRILSSGCLRLRVTILRFRLAWRL